MDAAILCGSDECEHPSRCSATGRCAQAADAGTVHVAIVRSDSDQIIRATLPIDIVERMTARLKLFGVVL